MAVNKYSDTSGDWAEKVNRKEQEKWSYEDLDHEVLRLQNKLANIGIIHKKEIEVLEHKIESLHEYIKGLEKIQECAIRNEKIIQEIFTPDEIKKHFGSLYGDKISNEDILK